MFPASACGLGWRGRISGTTWGGTGQENSAPPGVPRGKAGTRPLPAWFNPRPRRALPTWRGDARCSRRGAACAAAASERCGLRPLAASGVCPGRPTAFRKPKARGPPLRGWGRHLPPRAGVAARVLRSGCPFPPSLPRPPSGAGRSDLLPPPRRSSGPQRQRGVGDTSRGPVPAAVSGGFRRSPTGAKAPGPKRENGDLPNSYFSASTHI